MPGNPRAIVAEAEMRFPVRIIIKVSGPIDQSVRAVTAVDVEDVTRDEPGFVRRDEDDTIGDLLGEAEATQRNLRR